MPRVGRVEPDAVEETGVVGDVGGTQRGVGLGGGGVDAPGDLAVRVFSAVVGVAVGIVGTGAEDQRRRPRLANRHRVLAVEQRAVLGDDEKLALVTQAVVGELTADGDAAVVDMEAGAVVR